jgi:hypothetical protein
MMNWSIGGVSTNPTPVHFAVSGEVAKCRVRGCVELICVDVFDVPDFGDNGTTTSLMAPLFTNDLT